MIDHLYASWQGNDPFILRFARDTVRRYVRQQQIVVAKCNEKRSAGRLETFVEHASECPCFDCTGIQPPPVFLEKPDPLEYYRVIIEHGGGIITLSDHLGVLVGDDSRGTPAGWLYVLLTSNIVKNFTKILSSHGRNMLPPTRLTAINAKRVFGCGQRPR